MDRKIVLQILNLLGFVMMVLVNYAANAIPINNITTGEVSELYPNLFTPAGFTFSIWGLIYVMLLAFCIYQGRDLFTSNKQAMPFLKDIGYFFFISTLLNTAWIFAWHYRQILLSLLIMVSLLAVLIFIYLRLGVGNKNVSTWESFLVHLPFRVYLGWIIIATIANVTTLLVDIGWGRFGLSEEIWTVLVIVTAAIIILSILKFRQDIPVSLVAIWALLGIVVQRAMNESLNVPVMVAAMAAIVIIAVFAAFNLPRSLKQFIS